MSYIRELGLHEDQTAFEPIPEAAPGKALEPLGSPAVGEKLGGPFTSTIAGSGSEPIITAKYTLATSSNGIR